ncbi:hypothetical protein M8J77_014673 [Diaphorina citri]|nr:hypothetical protein M8J77_014673 [Diaphorina citri]
MEKNTLSPVKIHKVKGNRHEMEQDTEWCVSSGSNNKKMQTKHALRQQARRRKKNTTIAAGGTSPVGNAIPPTTTSAVTAVPPLPTPTPVTEAIVERGPPPTMMEVLSSIPGFSFKHRKRSNKKLSTAAQLEQTKEGCIDLETPDSILVHTNLRCLLNRHTFSSLPALFQYKLIQLLPQCDRIPQSDSTYRLSASGLNNEFFARACLEWQERLSEGEFTPENQQKLRQDAEKEKSRLDPWKLKHFEPIWGETNESRNNTSTSLASSRTSSRTSADHISPSPLPPPPPRLRTVGAVTRAITSYREKREVVEKPSQGCGASKRSRQDPLLGTKSESKLRPSKSSSSKSQDNSHLAKPDSGVSKAKQKKQSNHRDLRNKHLRNSASNSAKRETRTSDRKCSKETKTLIERVSSRPKRRVVMRQEASKRRRYEEDESSESCDKIIDVLDEDEIPVEDEQILEDNFVKCDVETDPLSQTADPLSQTDLEVDPLSQPDLEIDPLSNPPDEKLLDNEDDVSLHLDESTNQSAADEVDSILCSEQKCFINDIEDSTQSSENNFQPQPVVSSSPVNSPQKCNTPANNNNNNVVLSQCKLKEDEPETFTKQDNKTELVSVATCSSETADATKQDNLTPQEETPIGTKNNQTTKHCSPPQTSSEKQEMEEQIKVAETKSSCEELESLVDESVDTSVSNESCPNVATSTEEYILPNVEREECPIKPEEASSTLNETPNTLAEEPQVISETHDASNNEHEVSASPSKSVASTIEDKGFIGPNNDVPANKDKEPDLACDVPSASEDTELTGFSIDIASTSDDKDLADLSGDTEELIIPDVIETGEASPSLDEVADTESNAVMEDFLSKDTCNSVSEIEHAEGKKEELDSQAETSDTKESSETFLDNPTISSQSRTNPPSLEILPESHDDTSANTSEEIIKAEKPGTPFPVGSAYSELSETVKEEEDSQEEKILETSRSDCIEIKDEFIPVDTEEVPSPEVDNTSPSYHDTTTCDNEEDMCDNQSSASPSETQIYQYSSLSDNQSLKPEPGLDLESGDSSSIPAPSDQQGESISSKISEQHYLQTNSTLIESQVASSSQLSNTYQDTDNQLEDETTESAGIQYNNVQLVTPCQPVSLSSTTQPMVPSQFVHPSSIRSDPVETFQASAPQPLSNFQFQPSPAPLAQLPPSQPMPLFPGQSQQPFLQVPPSGDIKLPISSWTHIPMMVQKDSTGVPMMSLQEMQGSSMDSSQVKLEVEVTVAPNNLGDNNGGVTSNVLPQPVPVESSGPVSSNVLAQSSVAAMVSSTPYISSVTTRPTTSLTSGKPQTKTTAGRSSRNVSNKPPPGAVNLERSYQICQAVIQNSPNRDQLKCQLKPPPALLAGNKEPPPPTWTKATAATKLKTKSRQQSTSPPVMVKHVLSAQGIPVTMAMLSSTHAEATENTSASSNLGQYMLVQKGLRRSSSAPPGNNKVPPVSGGRVGRPASVGLQHKHPLRANSDCACNLNAMVSCVKCGAFCHDDCISPSNLCSVCVIR